MANITYKTTVFAGGKVAIEGKGVSIETEGQDITPYIKRVDELSELEKKYKKDGYECVFAESKWGQCASLEVRGGGVTLLMEVGYEIV